MKRHKKCMHCGEVASEHCDFTPYMVPDTCLCEPEDWRDGDDIPEVCKVFVGNGDGEGSEERCETCGHEKQCHRAEKSAPEVKS